MVSPRIPRTLDEVLEIRKTFAETKNVETTAQKTGYNSAIVQKFARDLRVKAVVGESYRYNQETDSVILTEAHQRYGGVSIKAADNLPWSHVTIRRIWRSLNLPINEKRKRMDGRYTCAISAEREEQIYEVYEPCRGNAAEAARVVGGVTRRTVRNYWGIRGLTARGRTG